MKITVLATPTSKFGPFTVVYDLRRWPAGTRRNRGWEGAAVVYERDATPDEIEEQRQSPRMLCYRNKDWDQLVNDEAKYGIDANGAKEAWRAQRAALAAPTPKAPPLELRWRDENYGSIRHAKAFRTDAVLLPESQQKRLAGLFRRHGFALNHNRGSWIAEYCEDQAVLDLAADLAAIGFAITHGGCVPQVLATAPTGEH